ncbi:Wadjet anti-phage system protein JetD domain-containing protein [Promicromonospora soli]
MRTPDQIARLARIRYDSNWRDWLTDPPSNPAGSFNLDPPSAKDVAERSGEVARWKRLWRDWSRTQSGVLREKTYYRTAIGDQQVYTHVDLAAVADLAAFDPTRAADWRQATRRWQDLAALPRTSHRHLKPHLKKILIELPEPDFRILLAAVDWFTRNPRSGLTIRQVPVEGMHTKWLARQRTLVLACLGALSSETPPAGPQDDEDEELAQAELDALGLKALPPHADLILADPTDRALIGGLRHLRAPVPELAGLPVAPKIVIVVENKESAYLIPDQPGVIVIHSLGNHLNVLDGIPWIAQARCVYWGDLDRAGLTLLSRARTRAPGIESVLMDPDTYRRYEHLAVRDTTKADLPDPTLTTPEITALEGLSHTGQHKRLEQERLPATYALGAIVRTVARGPRE